MTPARAQQIWANRAPFGELEMTADERKYVRGIWVRMPGHTCFADALVRIANGQAEGIKPMIGTAVFYNGDEIIVQVPVYEGEDINGSAVGARARRSIEMLGMPATDPVHGCNARLVKFGSASVKFYPLGH